MNARSCGCKLALIEKLNPGSADLSAG